MLKHSCAVVWVGGHYTVFMMLVCVASQAGSNGAATDEDGIESCFK